MTFRPHVFHAPGATGPASWLAYAAFSQDRLRDRQYARQPPAWAASCPPELGKHVDGRFYAHPLARALLGVAGGGLRGDAASTIVRLQWMLEADPAGAYAALDAAWWVGGEAAVRECLDAVTRGLHAALTAEEP